MQFDERDVPVACSMMQFMKQPSFPSSCPLLSFVCYWSAFNNIYVAVADRHGKRPRLRKNEDGSLQTRLSGNVSVPKVTYLGDKELIDLAFKEFPKALKCALIEHPSTRFFADRTPRWCGNPIEADAKGQRLNGVLNVGYTQEAHTPIWAPIDILMFNQYAPSTRDWKTCDTLARQILDILYTVRNNTFHGGKRADDNNDIEVLEKAIPLLEMIVKSFLCSCDAVVTHR